MPKNNIKEWKNHLLDIANENYPLKELYGNLGIVKTELANTSLKIGDSVKVVTKEYYNW